MLDDAELGVAGSGRRAARLDLATIGAVPDIVPDEGKKRFLAPGQIPARIAGFKGRWTAVKMAICHAVWPLKTYPSHLQSN